MVGAACSVLRRSKPDELAAQCLEATLQPQVRPYSQQLQQSRVGPACAPDGFKHLKCCCRGTSVSLAWGLIGHATNYCRLLGQTRSTCQRGPKLANLSTAMMIVIVDTCL